MCFYCVRNISLNTSTNLRSNQSILKSPAELFYRLFFGKYVFYIISTLRCYKVSKCFTFQHIIGKQSQINQLDAPVCCLKQNCGTHAFFLVSSSSICLDQSTEFIFLCRWIFLILFAFLTVFQRIIFGFHLSKFCSHRSHFCTCRQLPLQPEFFNNRCAVFTTRL